MTRRTLALWSVLIVGSWAAAGWAQAPSQQRQSLADRMAELARGWSGEAERTEVAPPPRQRAGSVAPLENSQRPRTARRSPTGSRPLTIVDEDAPHADQSVGEAPTEPGALYDGFTLPGLGGSRLPGAGAATEGADVSRELARDYATIQPDGRVEQVEPDQSIVADAETENGITIQPAPPQRAPIQVDPQEFQRELAGAFEVPTARRPIALRSVPEDEPEPQVADEFLAEVGSEPSQAEPTPIEPIQPIEPSPSPQAETAFRSVPRVTTEPEVRVAERSREVFGQSTSEFGSDPHLLVSNQTPLITTDISGPRQITIGREATYRVRLQNQSDFAAEGIVANVRIPSWADVVETTTTHGSIQQSQAAQAPSGLEWQLVRLEARGSATLDIRLVPRNSRPLELGVSWTLAPVGSRAVVEVQEPKLQIHLSGPEDVLFGKPQMYRLTLTNPGTGAAEDVQVAVVPPGGSEESATTQRVGDLAPGSTKSIEVELTAREAGKLLVKAAATAEGDLAADASKEVFCRKPELEVDWRGPEMKYAGTDATYFFRVRNPGTASADEVSVRVTLPEGAELVSASEGQTFDAQRRQVAWQVGTLGPGDDYYMELKCVVTSPGVNHLDLAAATADGELADNKQAQTNVVALADLKLEVTDPGGPVAVGEEAVYEISVRNRGASAAHDVDIAALFSRGIEPSSVEGAQYSVSDGRVTFRTIEELPAGRNIVLRIRARAVEPGNHLFRAEVLCRELGVQLASEETTRFYQDDVIDSGSDHAGRSAVGMSTGFESSAR